MALGALSTTLALLLYPEYIGTCTLIIPGQTTSPTCGGIVEANPATAPLVLVLTILSALSFGAAARAILISYRNNRKTLAEP